MFEETNVVPNVKIRVEFDSTGDEITLTGKNALNKLCQICKEHNVPFRAELFTDMLLESSPDYVEYRHKIIISDGYKMIPCKEFEMYVLKNINLIKRMILPLFKTITNFSDILTPKSFDETLSIIPRLGSRLEIIKSALYTTRAIVKHYGQGVGWSKVCDRIDSITENVNDISGEIKESNLGIDNKLSSLKEDISTMFNVEM